MATEVVEDDEAWLYGDGEKKEGVLIKTEVEEVEEGEEPSDGATTEAGALAQDEDKEAGEVSGGEENEAGEHEEGEGGGDDDDDDDDSDDDVQVTIGDLKTQTSYDASSKFKTTYRGSQAQVKAQPTKGVDVDAMGTINGVPTFEYDLNTLQPDERPWRKPGADITDYFNYGFTEETWVKYCDKQKVVRQESGVTTSKLFSSAPRNTPKPNVNQTEDIGAVNSETSPFFNRRAGPPPGRKMSGTIDVIGGTTRDSRRPARPDYEEQPFEEGQAISTIGTVTSGPPPMVHPPPDFSSPPPGMHPPPGPPPPGMPPPPYGYGPPPVSGPPPRYPNQPGYGGQYRGPPPFGGPPPPGGPGWNNRPPPGGYQPHWGYGRSPPHSDSDFSSSDDERERYPSSRDYQGDRDRDRYGGYGRDRDRSRSHDRDRDRERRHRDRGDREEKHKSKRRDKDDEHKSKHKKSKRSKRDKEEESMDTGQKAA